MATIEQQNKEKPGYGEDKGLQPVSLGNVAPSYNSPRTQTGTGRFTNIQKYLGANTGAGQQIGEQIGQRAEQQAEQVRKGVESAKGQFQQQYNPEQQRLSGASQFIQQSVANPQNLSPEQIKQYQQLSSGQYAAPNVNLAQQQQQAQKLQQAAQMGQSESGRYDLLRQAFGQPGYTQGQRKLDQLFLQTQNPQALQNKLTQTAASTGSLVGAAGTDLQNQLNALKSLASGAQTEATTQAGSTQENLLKAGQEKAGQLSGEQKNLYDALTAALSGKNVTEEQYKQAQQTLTSGQVPEEFQGALGLKNIDPSVLLGIAPEQASLGQGLGSENIAKLNVLQQLTGSPVSGLGATGAFSPTGFLSGAREKELRRAGEQELSTEATPVQEQITRHETPALQAADMIRQGFGSGGWDRYNAWAAQTMKSDPTGFQAARSRGGGNWQETIQNYVNDTKNLKNQLQQIQAPYQRSLQDILNAALPRTAKSESQQQLAGVPAPSGMIR